MDENYMINRYSDSITIIENTGVRMFLIKGTSADMLVDTGFGNIDLRKVLSGLTDKNVFVVNTHADGDHIGSNEGFDTIFMHPSDFDRYAKSRNSASLLPLFDGDCIDLGSSRWEVIHVPGHTPGSIMLLDRDSRILISGDTIQFGPIYMFGEGRNMDAFIYSLERFKDKYEGSFDVILPSHGQIEPPLSIIDSLLSGARDVVGGTAEAEEPERSSLPTYLYRTGDVSFYYGQR